MDFKQTDQNQEKKAAAGDDGHPAALVAKAPHASDGIKEIKIVLVGDTSVGKSALKKTKRSKF